ncbi:class I SAM-dependent DNA methyltransferase [Planctomycetota bacterium]
MAADSTVTIQNLSSHLQRCGYHHPLLKQDFRYADLTVPLVGFADQTYDARSACIAIIDSSNTNKSNLEPLANQYRKLGAPLLFMCSGKTLQWCYFKTKGLQFQKPITSNQISNFFDEYRNDFAPQSIYRAKTIARLDPQQPQLRFVDVGLMPLLESEMGAQLAGLIKRMIQALHDSLGKPKIDQNKGKWLFQSAFWLLAARILKDKKVRGFLNINLKDPLETLQRVHHHYNAEQPPESYSKRQINALQAAANKLNDFGNLRNLTIESLAYVYENTLINKDVRKALGIHATPSYLVDYIVWQLAGWIKEIPQEKRIVLEPTCGHAPFLISAARLLREMTNFDDNKKLHNYLKNHLFGIEMEPFAREIARLSLTLTDIPNPNSWKLLPDDVYQGKTLQNLAKKSMILLCNPPFQNFTPKEKIQYTHEKNIIQYNKKAAEILARTLPHMPEGSVFGVILPRSFLKKGKNAIPLRRLLVENYEIREICVLPDKIFTWSDHETTVILGRKHISKKLKNETKFVRVREHTFEQFKSRYLAPSEFVPQSRFLSSKACNLEIPELEQVWVYCQSYDKLSMLLDVKKTGKGLEYENKNNLPRNVETISTRTFAGAVKGYAKFEKNINLTGIPIPYYMNLSVGVLRRAGQGILTGVPQIILNSSPVSRGPWRLKALIDKKGHSVTSNYIAIRPKSKDLPLEVLWAILNSPLSNAYIYCHGTKRIIGVERILNLPIPSFSEDNFHVVNTLVKNYFDLFDSKDEVLRQEVNKEEAKKRMLAIDAEVMRLYNLPPRLERQVLDLFIDRKRKGVDFELDRYYPEDFDSWIPLHIYLSDEYQRSTVSFVKKWVEETRSPEIIKALETAVEAFKED